MSLPKIEETPIQGLYTIEPAVYGDERGWFSETYNRREFASLGLCAEFVQDNSSLSRCGVLRGLHYQTRHPQAKLVRVACGSVFDVAVDIRLGSATFGRWFGVTLTAENAMQLYIPEGFAHGFYTLSESAVLCYKVTDFYRPGDEGGIIWSDPEISVSWPIPAGELPVLSARDTLWRGLGETIKLP